VGAGGAGDLRDDDESPVSVVRRADVPKFAVRLARGTERIALKRRHAALFCVGSLCFDTFVFFVLLAFGGFALANLSLNRLF
jgi:hypothetical protein